VCLVPLPEWCGIDLDDSGAGQGVGTDELVVRWVEGDTDDTDLAGNALRSPGEVAGVDAEGAELAVATTGADKMDTLGTDTGVGGLATLLECSVGNGVRLRRAFGLCIIECTSSCGTMRAWHQRPSACDANHERYCCGISCTLLILKWCIVGKPHICGVVILRLLQRLKVSFLIFHVTISSSFSMRNELGNHLY